MTTRKKAKAPEKKALIESKATDTAKSKRKVAEKEAPAQQSSPGFPVVGIGASAGGLAAFEAFFSGLPADSDPGMAFVLVQHLAPDHKSILSDLIKRYTRMQVFEVEDGMEVKINCIYVIPPNRDMAFLDGTLHLLEPAAPRGVRLSIDFFFRSLAQDQRERAIGIILSGTGTDGSLGLRVIKGEGGMVMAQKPESSEYDGMPSNAIATGLVDYVLPPSEMATQLIAYAGQAFKVSASVANVQSSTTDYILKKICVLLRDQVGHDFSQYKRNTLARRVERRMAVHQIELAEHYLRFMQQTPAEGKALFGDLLIGVTNFFRDPEAFTLLEQKIIPQLFDGKSPGTSVRVWVCGCATGEEAYSFGILLQEHLETLKKSLNVQVFATDIDPRAIEFARAGLYPPSIIKDLSAERLARFFTLEPETGCYRIHKTIRDLLIFSEQNVIKDPPFSKLDLVSCRNLLIYLNTDLQKKLMGLFHYALNPQGVLLLGTSETVGDSFTLFTCLDPKQKFYQRKDDRPGMLRPAFGTSAQSGTKIAERIRTASKSNTGPPGINLRGLTESTLLAHYESSSVLINSRGEILHLYGRTGKYLEPADGDAAMNILAMAREGLRPALTSALYKVATGKKPVFMAKLRVKTNGDFTTVDLTIRPAVEDKGAAMAELFLVILQETATAALLPEAEPVAAGGSASTGEKKSITHLEKELRAKDEYLQNTLEEMETTNEELRSTNEEMQSVNEELQSTNEEMESSKEELQSVNEELAIVNAELQNKVTDLSQANNDMNNLLAGTGVATLFVDHNLRIVRFTPSAKELINLIGTDLGRPVADIASNLVNYDRLVEDVREVLAELVPRDIEVQIKTGIWFQLRIRPYRTLANVIEGAVISFVNITELWQTREDARKAQTLAENIIETVRDPLLVLDATLRVVSANQAFFSTFQVAPEQTLDQLVYDLGNKQWNIPALRTLLEEILPEKNEFNDYPVSHMFETIGQRAMLLNGRRVIQAGGQTELILLTIEDVTVHQGGRNESS